MDAKRDRLVIGTLLVVLLAVPLGGAIPAAAQCSYTTLTYSSPVPVSLDPTFLRFTQATNYWSAVGIGHAPEADWDLYLYSGTAAHPACVDGWLTSSTRGGGTDFVIGDFNHAAQGTYYLLADFYYGTGDATLEWDDAADQIFVRGPSVERFMQYTEVLDVYDVWLEAGVTYSFQFQPSGGVVKLLLFANPGDGSYFANRDQAVFEVDGITTWVPPRSDFYGLVVMKDDGYTAQYRLGVGDCSPPLSLSPGVATTTGYAENYFRFDQNARYWTAIGVRGAAADWEASVHSSPSGTTYPNCLGPLLGSSQCAPDTVDLVVGDFNFIVPGTFYSRAFMAGGIGSGNAMVEWDGGEDVLVVNGWPEARDTGPDDLLEVWDVWLVAGQSYQFNKWGDVGTRLMLFRNTAGGSYWAGRRAAQFEMPQVSAEYEYLAPATGWYGVVVVNDTGESGRYWVQILECPPPAPLAAGEIQPMFGHYNHYSFTPGDPYWTAVGARGEWDWDLYCYATSANFTPPICGSDLLAMSADVPPHMDFIVGDFNLNPYATYYTMAGWGDLPAAVQWDAGQDQIVVGGPTIQRATDGSRLLEVWDVALVASVLYTFRFESLGDAAHTLFVFENATGGSYWAVPTGAVLKAESPGGQFLYTPTQTGWHGVVVANENGLPGAYTLRIDAGIVGVEPPPPAVTELGPVAPNPARGPVRLDFVLREAGEVVVQVLDAGGRRVAEPVRSERPAGRWSEVWDGRAPGGQRLAPGVYLVRMEVDGKEVGRRRVILLD